MNSGGDANGTALDDEDWVSLIKYELGSILDSGENVNDDVFEWIQKNLTITPDTERQRLFVRALVIAVVCSTMQGEAEKCRMKHDLLSVRAAILKRYINKKVLELQALYAVQALNRHLDNPPRLLGVIFNVLYDEDVIPKETFYAWQKSTDANETFGKGVALKSVTSFFDWLRDDDEEPTEIHISLSYFEPPKKIDTRRNVLTPSCLKSSSYSFEPMQVHRTQQHIARTPQGQIYVQPQPDANSQEENAKQLDRPRSAESVSTAQDSKQSPPRHPSPVPTPTPSSSPDASHPGLAPSPLQQGSVVVQPQPQPQPQPYGFMPQQRQPVYTQPNPRGPIQILQAPSSGHRQMSTGQMNVPTSYMQSQPFVGMQYPQQQQQQQRDQQVYPQQGQYLEPPQQQFQTRPVYPAQQYTGTAQTPQGQMYAKPGMPSYYTNITNSPPVRLHGGPTFFPGTGQTGMVVAPQQIRQVPVLPQAPQYNQPQKKKNIIRIVDPKSNQDIIDTIIRDASKAAGSSSPHSGHSSASETPPASQTPPQNHQVDEKKAAIQAQFAAKVARLAHDSPPGPAPDAQLQLPEDSGQSSDPETLPPVNASLRRVTKLQKLRYSSEKLKEIRANMSPQQLEIPRDVYCYAKSLGIIAEPKESSEERSQKNRFKEIERKAPKDKDEFEVYRSMKVESFLNVGNEAGFFSKLGEIPEPEVKLFTTRDTAKKPAALAKGSKIQRNYIYSEGQWSPMNPEGRKRYSRDFLLQFQEDCKEKPEGLPYIPDIILDKAQIRPLSFHVSRINNKGADFTLLYLKSPHDFIPPFGQGMQSSGQRSSSQRVSQTVKLNTAGENSWKPDKDGPTDDEEGKTKDLLKKIKSLLNKLTPNNFQTLKTEVMSFPIDTEERLKGVVDLVFEKAINELAFSKTYAQLCRDLSQLKVPAASGNGMVQFRTLLINRCQKEFEKEKRDEQEEKLEREKISQLPMDQRTSALEDLEIKLTKNKQRMLGNIRFIGELFKLQMLIEQIMHDCIFKLLCSKDDESLECMCHLMSTIGKILDHEKAKNRIDQYFHQIKTLTTQKKTSARIRFMLQDVMDLRHRNWVPRRADDNPKTIEQIRQDFKREEEQKKMEGIQAQMQAPPPRMSRGKRDQPQRVGPPQQEGWNTVASTKAARVSVDPSKFRVTKQSIDDDIQLGPGRVPFGGWSRGSSGGSSKAQQSQEPPEPRQSNRYMMLSDDRRGRGPSGAEVRGRGPQGLGGKRSSSSRERDQSNRERQMAIAEVQRISGARRSGSREKDREFEMRRGKPEPTPAPAPSKEPAKPAPAAPELTEEVFQKKAMATIEEYLNIRDIEEAIRCVGELQSPSLMHVLVQSAMNCSLEKSAQDRDSVGKLFHKLFTVGHLTKEKFVDGVKEVLVYADDMALDVPLIWKYLGEIIGSTFRDNSLSLKLLADVMEPVRAAEKAGDLMAEILLTAVKLNGANVVAEMWQSSCFTWEMFLPSGRDVEEFVNNKKLEFTLSAASGSTTNSGGDAKANNADGDWVALIKRELGCLLASGENVNNSVFDWIQKNLDIAPGSERQRLFIRALVTVVVQSTIQGEAENCRMNHDLLSVRTAILQRYINNDNVLELQALYAVQALNQHLENPPRLLGVIFNVLYDEDIIPEETFYAWQKSTDANETLGKGVALKSVTSFFDWLRDADEEPTTGTN